MINPKTRKEIVIKFVFIFNKLIIMNRVTTMNEHDSNMTTDTLQSPDKTLDCDSLK